MEIKELTYNDIKSLYSNQNVLKEAFKEIKNSTIINCNDEKAIILDEENQVFYEINYEIDSDTNDLVMRSFTPVVLKEEKIDTKSIYARAMNESVSEEDSLSYAKKLARIYARKSIGGDKNRIVSEAKLNSGSKKIDKGRKQIVEDLNVFKSSNRKLINEIKDNGFYEKFAEKLNDKYMKDSATVIVEDKINFNLIDLRNKSKNITETSYKKKIGKVNESKLSFNPVDVIRNSPSFTSKLDKFMADVHMLHVSGKDKDLEESKEIFAKFASNWPVLYNLTERKHRDFAIKYFSNSIGDKEKAREYIDLYSNLVTGEKFINNQKQYLEENKLNIETESLNESKLSKTAYNARVLDECKRAIETLRANVDKIESFNVENYLRFSEDKLNEMLRTGNFNEDLFEQIVTDLFGDGKLVLMQEEVFDDEDFKDNEEFKKQLTEDEVKAYELEEQTHRLVVELRDLMPRVDKSVRINLEEEYDLLKSMSSIKSYDEEKLADIQNLVEGLKKNNKAKNEEIISEDKTEAYCPGCHAVVSDLVTEAKEDNKDTIVCSSCKTKLKV